MQLGVARRGLPCEVGTGLLCIAQADSLARIPPSKRHRFTGHAHFRLKLRHCGSFGWILMHADERDDDLLPFTDFIDQRYARGPGIWSVGPMGKVATAERSVFG